jgi:uncharacterized protein YjbJ (UPF0337 family)
MNMRAVVGSRQLLLWRGLLRQGWGRLAGNARMVATGRTEQALARIALAHARINRQAARDLRHLYQRHERKITGRPRLTLVH